MFSNNIKRGVMKVIKARLAEAQRAHDEECDEAHATCEADKAIAEVKRDNAIKASEDKHINSIIGKLI